MLSGIVRPDVCEPSRAAVPGDPATRILDDFEADPQGWTFIGVEEFPGAKGSLTRDATEAHGGNGSYKLEADFRGGGAYVGTWKTLGPLAVVEVAEFHLWVKATFASKIGVRLADETGQVFQRKNVPLAATDDWQPIVLTVRDFEGGEHWGGANDGRWHGPPTAIGFNVSKDALAAAGATQGTLWLDDLTAVVVPPGTPTIQACTLSQPACRPAYGVEVTYRWHAEPIGPGYKVFVHVRRPDGKTAFQGDHDLPGPSSAWSGSVEYQQTLVVPPDLPLGEYRIIAGLWHPQLGTRLPLKAGEGVTTLEPGAYQVGVLRLADDAPLPKLAPPTLSLDGYKLTFDEDFTGPELSVSARGPGTRWIAHTPYAGDFGDARFADPTKDFPFTLHDGILRIEARKSDGKWMSGLLASVDRNGDGFAQKFGYFEMRAKFPPGPGVWPAFWLLSLPGLKDKSITKIEIDVVEQYGARPNMLSTHLHYWGPGDKHRADGKPFLVTGMTDDFHRYGVMVADDFTTFYFDGVELRRVPTPVEAKVPLYLLVDLALGGGWPIDKTPNPSILEVDYVRAYSK